MSKSWETQRLFKDVKEFERVKEDMQNGPNPDYYKVAKSGKMGIVNLLTLDLKNLLVDKSK